ncbi:MAG: MerR family transcriptional regulator [Gammaproteobacteria bacterium]|nr:MerR family transcriptional regulator [Gammaproteobacteria bacterium]
MKSKIISGVVIEQEVTLSPEELAQACSVPDVYISQLVDAGILEPAESASNHWRFQGNCLSRVQISIRLQRDLEINLPGIAVILDLLEIPG